MKHVTIRPDGRAAEWLRFVYDIMPAKYVRYKAFNDYGEFYAVAICGVIFTMYDPDIL